METADAKQPLDATADAPTSISTTASTTASTASTSSAPASDAKMRKKDTKHKGFACLFCARLFNRSDSLKRHWTTCAVRRRQALETPQVVPKTRGRKPQACDRCCRLKRACTFTDPCETCVRSKRTCTYTRAVPATGSSTTTANGTVDTIVSIPDASSVDTIVDTMDTTSPSSSETASSGTASIAGAARTNSSASTTSIVGDSDNTPQHHHQQQQQQQHIDPSLPLFTSNEIDWILDSVDMNAVGMGGVTVDNLNLDMDLGLGAPGNDLSAVFGVGMNPADAATAASSSMAMMPLPATTAMPTAMTTAMPTAMPTTTTGPSMMPPQPDYMQYTYLQPTATYHHIQQHQQHQQQQQQQQQHQQQSFQQSSALMLRLIRRPTEVDLSALCEFSFLERITRTSGLVDSFHCGSQEQRRTIAQVGQEKLIMGMGRVNASGLGGRSAASLAWSGWSPLALGAAATDDDDNTRLLAKTHDIVSQIREVTLARQSRAKSTKGNTAGKTKSGKKATKGKVDEGWSPAMETLCYDFFRPANIHKCLALFWSFWYPNSPTIHGPSFTPATAPTMLLASMVLVGACLAPDDNHSSQLHSHLNHLQGGRGRRGQMAVPGLWFDAVEEMVFREDHDEIDEYDDHNDDTSNQNESDGSGTDNNGHDCDNEDCDHEDCADPAANMMLAWQNSTHTPQRNAQLARLQAAFLVCLYQTWEGTPRAKRRARQDRYTAVVRITREIGCNSATLRPVHTDSRENFDWNEYILRESLIRTVSYIFALDSAYALFYRHPPRMVLPELQTDLASPESCFRAETADACFAELSAWRTTNAAITGSSTPNKKGSAPITIASAVQTLCHGTMSREVELAFSRLSVLNMFTIVSALYAMTFKVETSLLYTSGPGGEAALIQTGLRHWIRLWPSTYRDQELYEMHATTATTAAASMNGGASNNSGGGGWPRAVGFMRHAPEYCLVAFFILARIRGGANDDGLPPPPGTAAVNVATPDPVIPPPISNTVSNAVRSSGVKNVNYAGSDMALLNALVTEFRCRKASSYCSRMLRQFCPPDMGPERSGIAM